MASSCSENPTRSDGGTLPTDAASAGADATATAADGGSADAEALDEEVPPEPEARTPDSLEEQRRISRRPGDPGVEVLFDRPLLYAFSGRIAPAAGSSVTPASAAADFASRLGARTLGWAHPQTRLARLVPETIPVAAERTTPAGRMRHWAVRFIQLHRGVPVLGREATVFVGQHDGDPGPLISGAVSSLEPEAADAEAAPENPGLSAEQAFTTLAANAAMTAAYGVDLSRWAHKGKLFYVPSAAGPKLHWRILAKGAAANQRAQFLVDAATGKVVKHFRDVQSGVWNDSTDVVTGTASAWSGTSPRAVDLTHIVYDTGAEYFGMVSRFTPTQTGIVSVRDGGDACWPSWTTVLDRQTSNFADADYFPIRYATDVYENVRRSLDFFRTSEFGWTGWDGKTTDLDVVVGFEDDCDGHTQTHNAYSTGSALWFPGGLGNKWTGPAGVCLDVVGHELGHSVLSATNPLEYANQSGALNESIADLTGESVQAWSSDVIAGCNSNDGTGWRSMADPTLYGQPDRMSAYRSDIVDDGGGVHTNSGVVNKAHYLMVKGTQGTPFNGWEVSPIAPNVPAASRALFHLVWSLLMANGVSGDVPDTLASYAASLYAWCRSPDAVYGAYGITSLNACGSVHDAFAAVELADDLDAPQTSLSLTPLSSAVATSPLATRAFTRIRYLVANHGSGAFDGPVTVEVTNEDGSLSFGKRTFALRLAGHSATELSITASTWKLVDELPAELRLRLTLANPALDATAADNDAWISLDTVPYPVGGWTEVSAEAGVYRLPLRQAGNFPLTNGQLTSRLLYRSSGADLSFKFLAASPQRAQPDVLLPAEGTGVVNVREAHSLTERLSIHVVGGSPAVVGGQRVGKLVMGRDGQLRDLNNQLLSGLVILAALNSDGRLGTSPSSPWLYCLNCRMADQTPFAVVYLERGVDLAALFPAELQPMLAKMIPLPPLEPPKVMLQGWLHWFPSLDPGDPEQLVSPPAFNSGP